MATPVTGDGSSGGGSIPKPVLVGEPGATGSHVLSGKDLRIAIVSTRWYGDEIVCPLTEACSKELRDKGVAASDLIMAQVSGAFELPFAAMRLIEAEGDRLDAVVCIGCMVKGRTNAYEFVSEAVTMGIMELNVKTDTPVIFGVLTVASEEDAQVCASARGSCGGSSTKCSHGVEWAQSALEMARLKHATAPKIAEKCKCYCHCDTKNCSCACHCSKCDCNTCSCSNCKCASCQGGYKTNTTGSSTKVCSQCGDSTDKCRCEHCMCKECSNKLASQTAHTDDKKCSQCGDQAGNCRCKDCKCTGCCTKGTTASETNNEHELHICSTCGTAADQCGCTDCQCSSCRCDKGSGHGAVKHCGDCCKA